MFRTDRGRLAGERLRMRVLEDAALRLEPQVAAHAEEMFAVLGDPAIYEYENTPPPSVTWLRERYAGLETRRSPDGRESWLNWVVRLPSGELAGYVQATVYANRRAAIAYVFASRHWGKGLASRAVARMIRELVIRYRVHTFSAVFKKANRRSQRLLQGLRFTPASPELLAEVRPAADERLMCRSAALE
jgi:ribosomal-protein-alanine N-acetyltransferase